MMQMNFQVFFVSFLVTFWFVCLFWRHIWWCLEDHVVPGSRSWIHAYRTHTPALEIVLLPIFLCILGCGVWATLSVTQGSGSFLVPGSCQGSLLAAIRGPYAVVHIKLGSTACKASTLSPVLFLQHPFSTVKNIYRSITYT